MSVMTKRLYHFTSARYGLEDIRKQRLKIAQFDDLNDPFELRSVRLLTRDHVMAFDLYRADMALRFGILCFSEQSRSILQWSNYADHHRGICLGFDVSNFKDKFGSVVYTVDKLPFPGVENLNEAFMWRMLCTKYKGWRYEEEWRVFIKLDTPERNEAANRDLYFYYFRESADIVLREIISGAENKNTLAELQDAVGEYPHGVKISRIHLSEESFRLERSDLST
jgi:Protein of unknown function (DUF2971)